MQYNFDLSLSDALLGSTQLVHKECVSGHRVRVKRTMLRLSPPPAPAPAPKRRRPDPVPSPPQFDYSELFDVADTTPDITIDLSESPLLSKNQARRYLSSVRSCTCLLAVTNDAFRTYQCKIGDPIMTNTWRNYCGWREGEIAIGIVQIVEGAMPTIVANSALDYGFCVKRAA